jgi:murein DD-endopeptidase MepM/ murein hydrolase activator NlpD
MLSDAIVGVTGKTSELTSQLAGGGIRAVLGTKGFVTRHGLESISNVIAGDTVIRNELKDRRKARDAQVDQEREGYKWGSFKDWKDQKYANRAKKMGELSDYLAEQQVDMSANIAESNAEISEQIKDTNEKMDSVEDNVQTLTDLGSEIGSIYVHDQGIHDRLDTIISIISKHFGVDVENNEEIPDIIDIDETSGFKELPELPESNTSIIPTDDGNPKDDVVGSAITAASTLAISGDTIETDELHDATSIIDEANKTDPSEEKITDDLKDMMSIQQDKKEEEKEDDDENESIFSKILSGVSGIGSSLLSVIGNIPSILTAALGIYALITNIDTVVSNISSWFKKDTDEDAQTKGANAVTAVVDTQADSLWDYAIPGADLYHNDKDATGEYIRNDAATNLKDDLLYETNLKTSLANSAWNNPSMNSLRSEISLDNAVKYAEKAESAKSSIGKKYYEYKSEKALNNAEKYEGMANSNEINTDNLTQKKLQNQADKAQAKADKYQEKADNATSEKQAEKYQKKADSAQAEASNLESEKEKFSNSTIGGVATQATKVGITYLGSSAAGGIASTIASKAGASEETASTIGNVTTSAVTAGVVAAEGLATMKGKTTALDKLATALVDGLASICSTIGTKLASSSLGKKLGADKISDWIKEFSSNLTTGFASKLTDTILKKINSGLEAVSAKLGLGTTLTLSTAGLAVLAGGAVGLLSGACTTPHLFGVAPDDADIWMKLISSALGAAFGAAEMTPAGWIFCIIDIIDEVVKMIPGGFFKYGLKGALAQGLYSLCGGSEKLEEKQERMSEIRENYNSTYGTNLDEATFNDYVNSSGLLDTIWNGTAKITDDNELVTDEGGKVKKSWGLKNIFVGNDTEYEKDENGNLIKDSNGNSIVKTDAYGNVQKKNAKIVDTIKDDANSIKRFFTGGTEYETDENGNVVYDENGNAVVAKEEKGLVGRIKENGLSASSILGDKAMNKAKAKAENMAETISTIKEKASNVLDNISTGLSSIGTSISDTASSIADKATTGLKNVKDSLDKKTSEIADKASELGDKAVSGLKSAGSSVLSFFGFGNKDSEEDTDEDGTKLSDNVSASANTGKAFKSTLSGLNKIKSKLLGDLTDTLDEWENEEYELDEDGNPLLDADGNKIKKGGISTAIKSSAAKITKSTLSKATDALDSVKSGLGSLWNSIKDKVFNTSKDSNDTTDVAIGGPEVSNYDDSDEAGAEAFREYQDKKQRQKYYENKNKSTNYDDSDEALFEYQQEQRAENYANSKVAGGNPLSQNYDITSGYGQRNISGIEGMGSMHYGVDLQPVDSSQITWVKSTYPGTIIDVKSDVPDTDTAEKTDSGWKYSGNNSSGNYVKYQTEDGQIIENMHLKQGSIPGSIFKGMHINAGTDLGQVGSTGFSTAPHLHYAIKDENGTYKDPTSSLNSSNPVDNSVKNEVLNDSTSSAQEYNSQYSSGDYSSSSSDSSSSGISGFISKLLSLGKQFISKLTGGLIGSDDSDSNSSIDSSSSYSSDNGNYTSYDSVELTTTPNTKWVEIVRDVKKAVAAYQPTYYTDAGSEKYVNVTANNKTYKTRVDCSGIIATMLKIYGVLGDSVNVTSSSLLSNNCIPSGFTQVSWPGWDKLVEGDIMARSGHTEIFAYNDGSKHYVYNGGSTKALRAAGATVSGGSPFTVIWRCNEVGSSIGTDGSSLVSSDAVNNNLSGGGTVSSASEQQVWSELDKLGYNDTAKAGIMGVWSSETNNRNDRIEGDYLKSFPGFDTVTTDNTALNDYTQNKLFGAYAKSGLSINKSAYKGSDGNLYPGFGIAQWTGPRAENLFKYTSNKGESWKSLKGQMDFFNNEMSTNVRGVTQSDMNSQKSPSDAAKLFANKFEGTSKSDWISQRQANANRIYNSLAGSTSNGDSTTALGGPIQNNAPIEITEDSGIQISAPDAKKSRKKKIDDNKIIDMNRVLQNRNKSSKQDEGSSSDGTTSKRGVGGPKIDTNAIPDKSELKLDKICIGGPSSNIGNTSTYTKSTTTSANKKTTSSNSNIVNFSNRSTNNTSSSNNTSSDNININTTEIVEALQKMIVVLQSIDGNTSKSNTLLNNLGTGTNGTTSSSTSSRTVKNSSKAYSSIKNSSNNSRMITSMARP